jgi:hypothetical protein
MRGYKGLTYRDAYGIGKELRKNGGRNYKLERHQGKKERVLGLTKEIISLC